MAYAALPDHRMPYDNDGTIQYSGSPAGGATRPVTNAVALEWNDEDYAVTTTGSHNSNGGGTGSLGELWTFFPEQREVTGYYFLANGTGFGNQGNTGSMRGSNDTTNGLDGTWETASLAGGVPTYVDDHSWRSGIKPISFTGPKKNLRWTFSGGASNVTTYVTILHLYGEAASGQMAHDIVFLDPDLGSGVPFPAPEDFGDQPLGTTVVRPFRIKNTSASRTATNINLQCNDTDFVIAESASGPWVVTINLASLAAGAESPTYYVRCTTPGVGSPLKPRFARIVAICDAGFFG
jgi:hypothetical protein